MSSLVLRISYIEQGCIRQWKVPIGQEKSNLQPRWFRALPRDTMVISYRVRKSSCSFPQRRILTISVEPTCKSARLTSALAVTWRTLCDSQSRPPFRLPSPQSGNPTQLPKTSLNGTLHSMIGIQPAQYPIYGKEV